ncbi:MAG TPA: hypothetical protein VLV18_05415 [Terriglobales bacterium]|nr:hypothetical protein [Terriglobales bacterium]
MTTSHHVGVASVWLRKGFPTKVYDHFLHHEEWNVGIVHDDISSLLRQNSHTRIDWFPNLRKDRYLADPFGISFQGRTYVICEEFQYRSSKGRIVTLELDGDFLPSRLIVSLEFPFHTSYPYLFEFDGEIYCVPETAFAREVSLYRALDFPSGWRKVCTLVDEFAGTDPTVFYHKGTWWLSATGEYGDDRFSKLFVWHAASLFGPWSPHKLNPVKVDFRSSRPAGTPFTHDGNLFRPAQDCSTAYGSRIMINRVLSLTENEFIETEAATISPDTAYPSGLHTVSQAGRVTFVDGRRYTCNRTAFTHAVLCAPSKFLEFLT